MLKKYPNNPVLQEVGAELIGKNKVTLPYYMALWIKLSLIQTPSNVGKKYTLRNIR